MTEPNDGQTAPPQMDPSRLEAIGLLRAQMDGILVDIETLWGTARQRTPLFRASRSRTYIAFRGHLVMDPDEGYALLRERFAKLGYTPVLHRQDDSEIVTALPTLFASSSPRRWWINLLLLLATLVTTTVMAATLEQAAQLPADNWLMALLREPRLLLSGIPASATLMGILGVHELAHYAASRKHGLDSSLPFFVPVPFGFGTLGAIIHTRSPWQTRNALFDVGAAGPLAGLLVALPLFFLGLMISPALPPQPGGMPLGTPLLLGWMEDLVYALRGIPSDYVIYVGTWPLAAWFGVIVTSINLLPIGQLDGGHVAYALLGQRTRILSMLVFLAIGVLAVFVWPGWFAWLIFSVLSGWRHPPPLNAISSISRGRIALGIGMLILTVLIFTPAPLPIA